MNNAVALTFAVALSPDERPVRLPAFVYPADAMILPALIPVRYNGREIRVSLAELTLLENHAGVRAASPGGAR